MGTTLAELPMPMFIHSSTAQGLVTAGTSREGFTRQHSFCMNKQSTNIHIWLYTVYCIWFVLIINLTNIDKWKTLHNVNTHKGLKGEIFKVCWHS